MITLLKTFEASYIQKMIQMNQKGSSIFDKGTLWNELNVCRLSQSLLFILVSLIHHAWFLCSIDISSFIIKKHLSSLALRLLFYIIIASFYLSFSSSQQRFYRGIIQAAFMFPSNHIVALNSSAVKNSGKYQTCCLKSYES